MNVTDIDFKEKVIEKSKEIPIIVNFWAEWCSPCQKLGPILEEIEKEYKGRFILAKINVSSALKTSQEYNIRTIPNVKMFKQGNPIAEFVGALSKEKIGDWLNKNLEK